MDNQTTLNSQKLDYQIDETRNSLKTDRLDMSYGEIMSMYETEELIIAPAFQRLFRWSLEQKTKFIESILMGIPIPSIFVAETDHGRWEIVDGLQRISTILSFFGKLRAEKEELNNWTLLEGDLISSLQGYTAETLPIKYIRNIRRAVCRVEVIKWDSKYDMRYELFSRLNTGGATLTPQEIRNCIYRNDLIEFYRFVEEFSKNEDYKNLMLLSEKQLLELYDQELIVRFFSLASNWRNVSTTADAQMDKYMKNMVKNKIDLTQEEEGQFRELIRILHSLGDKKIFRYPNSKFSPNLYDAITICTLEHIDYYRNNPEKLIEKIEKLKCDVDFKKLSGPATYSKNRIKLYVSRAMEIFGDY